MKLSFSYIFALCVLFVNAQQPSSSALELQTALKTTKALKAASIVSQVPFENIGPSVMSGRVVDLAVNPDNPTEFYVAYATAGVWHTVNNGTSFSSIMDNADTQNIADIDMHWPTRTLWVGTGENNASRSSYAGIGLLKTIDNGETWTFAGLPDSHHIGRIQINPDNVNEVVVGVTGHLYSSNDERGIYKTTDGGKTWKNTLFIDNVSGIIDLQVTPGNYNIMYASSWTKDRKAWNFDGSGANSAIFKSNDAGESWEKLTIEGSGFPTGEGVGRIGLAVFNKDVLYAIHDSQFRKPQEASIKNTDDLDKDDFKSMTVNSFLTIENSKLNTYLKTNGFHEKYRAENVKQMVRSGSVMPVDLAKYLENATTQLFDTPVIGAEVYKSTNGGKTWQKTHEGYLDGIYFSYGYYFGHIYVSPKTEDDIYIYGVPILKSKDGGKSFTSIDAPNVHADHHALWINPKNTDHLIDGNDGGVNITYDDGKHWIKNNSTPVGQFYAIQIDHQQPYNVYGGLQDNGVWKGPNNASESIGWQQSGHYSWESIMGGDGMQIQVDNRNADIVYTGYQFGNYFRLNLDTGQQKYIQPKHELGDRPYRFNWQTPILLSSHNQDILYLGGNKLLRSLNKGDDWQAISPDLTLGGKTGNVAYGSLTTISESPFQFGLLYTGSDDGLVQVSTNAGGSWMNISAGLPQNLWVSRVLASQHKKERVYVTLNGYRWDDFKAYVYVSDDHGKTWRSVASNLPNFPVNAIVEDPTNENLLYLGSDNGAFVSFNQGQQWDMFSKNLTAVAVHDIVIQPEAKHLLLGTHGRSIYRTDLAVLQEYANSEAKASTMLFSVPKTRRSSRWGNKFSQWNEAFVPNIAIPFFIDKSQELKIRIKSENGSVLNESDFTAVKGFNYYSYDYSISEKAAKQLTKTDAKDLKADNGIYYLPKGTYTIEINGKSSALELE